MVERATNLNAVLSPIGMLFTYSNLIINTRLTYSITSGGKYRNLPTKFF